MPLQVKYLQDGIEFIPSGVLTGEEIIAANEETYSSEKFLRARYKLVDRSAVTDYQVDSGEIRRIAWQDIGASKLNPRLVIVLVCPNSLQLGMSRMYQAYVAESGFRIEIFKDRKSADEWLRHYLSSERPPAGEAHT